VRLAKHLAHAGVASRRAAEAMIAAGRVTVDGATITDPARDVTGGEAIAVDGAPVGAAPRRVVYAVHKPAGVVSTAHDTHGRPTVVELVPEAGTRLYPVGRLDADTTGLILLTNDGALANHLTHPRYEVPKTYRAKVANPPVGERALRRLREGVELDDGVAVVDSFRLVDNLPGHSMVEVVLHEGRKHIVRRLLDAVGYPVEQLVRTAIGDVRLGNQRPGKVRPLTISEVGGLYKAVGL
jgi:23S rRNA pseudouridine2605 synthase